MVVSCWKGTRTRGHIWEKTLGEVMHVGHTHTHTLQSPAVPFSAAPVTLLWQSRSYPQALAAGCSRQLHCELQINPHSFTLGASTNSNTHLLLLVSPWLISPEKFDICSKEVWGFRVKWVGRERTLRGLSSVAAQLLLQGKVQPTVMIAEMSLRSRHPWLKWNKRSERGRIERSEGVFYKGFFLGSRVKQRRLWSLWTRSG